MIINSYNKGCEALSIGEWKKAKQLFEEVLRKEKSPEVYEKLAWAHWWLNNAAEVFEFRSKAYQLFLDKNNSIGASRNAGWIGLDYIEFKGDVAIATGWFKRAETLLEGITDVWEVGFIKILKARLAFQVEKNIDAAIKLLDESLEICRKLKNTDGEMIAEALKGFILVVEGKISEGMPLLDEATVLAISNEKSDIQLSTIACCYLIDACERVRDYERAGQWCREVKEICKRWRYDAMFANCRMKHAGVLIWKGEWREAESELLNAIKELKEFRPLQIYAVKVRLADLKRREGKWDEAEKYFNEAGTHPLKMFYYAALLFDKGEYEKSVDLAEKYLRRINIKEKAERTLVVELLLQIYIKLEKLKEAQILLNELRAIADSINTLPLKAALLNAEGSLNLAENNLKQAREKLENAIEIYDKISSPFESGRSRSILSEVLVKLGKPAQAEAELNMAVDIFTKLGAEKDIENAKKILKNLYKNNAEKNSKNVYDFTGRELEVLRLIAEGKNNEEIAEKLFLSVRTIEKHLTNIYSKMGVSGKSARAYAASYAIKHKLIFT